MSPWAVHGLGQGGRLVRPPRPRGCGGASGGDTEKLFTECFSTASLAQRQTNATCPLSTRQLHRLALGLFLASNGFLLELRAFAGFVSWSALI
ncbi:hypothetical protein MRX96_012259 [Rhipicephalus microplus]